MDSRAGHGVKVLANPGQKLRVVERLKQHGRDIVGAGEIGLSLCSHKYGNLVMVDPFIVPIQECGEKCAATGSHKAFPVFQTTATAYFRETYMYPEAPVTRIDFGAIFQSSWFGQGWCVQELR